MAFLDLLPRRFLDKYKVMEMSGHQTHQNKQLELNLPHSSKKKAMPVVNKVIVTKLRLFKIMSAESEIW